MERHYQEDYRLALISRGGWVLKNQDLVVCERCHAKIHPKNTGIPDYIHVAPDGVVSYVEAKGHETEWTHDLISEDQHKYIQDVLRGHIQNPRVYVAFMSGTERVNSSSPLKRQLYLIPYSVLMDVQYDCYVKTGYKYIPLNVEAAILERHRIKGEDMTFAYIFKDFRLPWQNGHFHIPDNHPYLRRG